MKLERDFQPDFIKALRERFPGCFILKNDTSYLQGVPDLLFLYGTFWAIFEVKRKKPTSSRDYRPNQEFYIDQLNEMSFSACVYPENAEEVLDEIQRQLQTRRTARVSKRK